MATNPGDLVAEGAITVSEALRLSGLGRSVLYEKMADGSIPYVQAGRRRLVPRVALRDYLARLLVIREAS